MSQKTIFPEVTPMIKVSGGTTGDSSRLPTEIYAMIGGDDEVSGIPPTGGGGGGSAGSPIGLLLALTYAS